MPETDRRQFIRVLAASAAARAVSPSAMQTSAIPALKALVFDACGTLFDVLSVTSLGEQLFPGHGAALAALWPGNSCSTACCAA